MVRGKGGQPVEGSQYYDQLLTSEDKAKSNSSGFRLSPFRRVNFTDNNGSSSETNYVPHVDDIEETK